MRIQILSDLHFEFLSDSRKIQDIINSLIQDVDILVIAGDLSSGSKRTSKIIELLCSVYKQVIFVAGNHEYYDCRFQDINSSLSRIKIPNFHFLNNGIITIDNQRFLGSTLWFRDNPTNIFYSQGLNDFDKICNFEEEVYKSNTESIDFLQNNVNKGDIVITHHSPCELSIHPRFKGDNINRFFHCDLSDLILDKEPFLWVHGHVHDSFDYQLGNTRIIANPFGYPSFQENSGFIPDLIIER